MSETLCALIFYAMLGSIVLTWWLLYFRHPSKPKPFKPGRGPIDEQRLTNSLLTVLILTLAGRDHR